MHDHSVLLGLEVLLTVWLWAYDSRSHCHPTELHHAVFVTADEPRERDDVQEPRVYEFGKMTEEQAKMLAGKNITACVNVIEGFEDDDHRVKYICQGESGPIRFVCFSGWRRIEQSQKNQRSMIVEGRLLLFPSRKLIGGGTQGKRITDSPNCGAIFPLP